MRYPRGKSWNWYKRSLGRGDFEGPTWLAIREAKRNLIYDMDRRVFGNGHAELQGLDGIIKSPSV